MDPDEALKRLRELSEVFLKTGCLHPDEIFNMMETFQGLDEWITRGGFLPSSWQAPSKG